ncbi:hypothetical protein [Streptomyces sp. NPDC056821]|uniref:hypothetical protein n=1 Tax=unclassified Streptomyces TaxID=2593676 RepID=UPI00368F827C
MSTATLPPAGDWIRSISIKQPHAARRTPHAACIGAGAKGIENRPQHWSWGTIRGRELPTGTVISVARLPPEPGRLWW